MQEVEPYGQVMAEDQAREITKQIKAHADHLWELIVVAYQGQAWRALNYDNWETYCDIEFQSLKIRLPRPERRKIIESLRDSGFSLRAIAAAAGIDKHTVARDLDDAADAAGNTDPLPAVAATATPGENRDVRGINGKRYRPRKDFSDSFWTVAYDMGKLGARINKLAGDSRFSDSRERIKEANLADLIRLRAVLSDVIAKLEGALK